VPSVLEALSAPKVSNLAQSEAVAKGPACEESWARDTSGNKTLQVRSKTRVPVEEQKSLRSLSIPPPERCGSFRPHAGLGTREVMTAESSGARMKRLACNCCVGVTFSWRKVSKVVRLSSQPLKESASGSGSRESGK
jgi:hypothetical protein